MGQAGSSNRILIQVFRRFSNSEDCSSEGPCLELHFVGQKIKCSIKILNGWGRNEGSSRVVRLREAVGWRPCTSFWNLEELRGTCVTCKGGKLQ